MSKFAPTPEGRAAADRMMQEYGHTNIGKPPRPGFPGRPGGMFGGVQPLSPQVPRDIGTGAPAFDPNNPRAAIQQMQSTLTGSPTGGGILRGQPTTPLGERLRTNLSTMFGRGIQQVAANKPAGMKNHGYEFKQGGSVKKKSGGSVSSASKRADGCAIKGKTKGRII